jgi:hypothetical protein
MSTRASSRSDLGELLRRILVDEDHVVRTAAALRLTPRGLYGRLQRGARFTPDEIAILLREIEDDRLIRWLWGGSRLLIMRRPIASSCDVSDALLQPLLDSAAECITALNDLAGALETAAPDVSQHEARPLPELEQHIDRAQAELFRFKTHLSSDRSPAELPARRETHDGFAALVNRFLLADQQIRPRDLADALGLSYHALHARLSGRASFIPLELKRLFQHYPDPRIADYLLAGTQYIAIPRPASSEPLPGYSPIRAGLLSLREIIRLLNELLRTADVHVHVHEISAAVSRGVDEALRQLTTMHCTMTHIGHRSPDHLGRHGALPQGIAPAHNVTARRSAPAPEASPADHAGGGKPGPTEPVECEAAW